MAITTLYSMPQVVTIFTPGAISVSTPSNRIDFKLFKNVANKVDFLVKTVDKRPSALVNGKILISSMSGALVLLVPLVEIDRLRGHYRLVMMPNQVAILNDVNYRYSVVSSDIELGEDITTYTDTAYSSNGYLEVDDSVANMVIRPIRIAPGDFLKHPDLPNTHISGNYPGAAQTNNITGRQTATVLSKNFTGTVVVKATLDDTPRDDGWFIVACRHMVKFTGLSPLAFTGNHMFLKFEVTENQENTGTLEEIKLKVN